MAVPPDHQSIEDLRPINSKCVRCSLCKFPPLVTVESAKFSSACPSYREYKLHSHSGGGRVVMALSLGEGRAEISREAQEAFFQCTLCGACDIACKYSSDIEILEMLYALRAESFRRVGPLPGQRRVLERLDEAGHPRPQGGRKGDWLRETGREAPAEGRDTLLWVGDRYALDPEPRGSLENLVRLLEAAGVAFAALGDDEPSTARVALDIGDLERFDGHARAAARAVRQSGARTVVCIDPHDLNAFRAHIPKVAPLDGVRVVHAVEFLDELASAGRLRPSQPLSSRVAYHDPCTLGRLSEPFQAWSGELVKVKGQLVIYDPPRPVNRGAEGCYEPPRRLLQSIPGLELVEFHRRREGAFCCGGDELVEAGGHGDLVAGTALHRMEEARAVGAELVATACPRCQSNLGAATGDDSIPVRNVIDLLAESVGV
jgi:Fe-S oxidoreductase